MCDYTTCAERHKGLVGSNYYSKPWMPPATDIEVQKQWGVVKKKKIK